MCLRQVLSASTMYALTTGSLAKRHASSSRNSLSRLRAAFVANGGIGAMQDVEQQRLEDERIVFETLKLEALERADRERVLHVIEDVRHTVHPGPSGGGAVASVRGSVWASVSSRRCDAIERVETLDGLGNVAVVACGAAGTARRSAAAPGRRPCRKCRFSGVGGRQNGLMETWRSRRPIRHVVPPSRAVRLLVAPAEVEDERRRGRTAARASG